jgi:hypothetical protein
MDPHRNNQFDGKILLDESKGTARFVPEKRSGTDGGIVVSEKDAAGELGNLLSGAVKKISKDYYARGFNDATRRIIDSFESMRSAKALWTVAEIVAVLQGQDVPSDKEAVKQ